MTREEAIEVMKANYPDPCFSDLRNAVDKAIKELEKPEIVRCKECKHYKFADNRAFGMPVKMCKWFGFEDVNDDDFCSRAERR